MWSGFTNVPIKLRRLDGSAAVGIAPAGDGRGGFAARARLVVAGITKAKAKAAPTRLVRPPKPSIPASCGPAGASSTRPRTATMPTNTMSHLAKATSHSASAKGSRSPASAAASQGGACASASSRGSPQTVASPCGPQRPIPRNAQTGKEPSLCHKLPSLYVQYMQSRARKAAQQAGQR